MLTDLPFLAGRWALLECLLPGVRSACEPSCCPHSNYVASLPVDTKLAATPPALPIPPAPRLAGLSLWDPRLGAVCIYHTGTGAQLTVLESDEAGVGCMGPDTWARSGMTIQDPAVPFWIEPLDVGRR